MDITFQEHPDVVIATNTFRNVETILQYEEFPLIEVGKFADAGYTTKFNVFHSDGSHMAVVKGARVFITEGAKAKVTARQEPDLTVCEMDGRPIIELRRKGASALKGWAELYAPHGVFIKAHETSLVVQRSDGLYIPSHRSSASNLLISDEKIGIHVTKECVYFGSIGGNSIQSTNIHFRGSPTDQS